MARSHASGFLVSPTITGRYVGATNSSGNKETAYVQKTVGVITLFNRKPTITETKRLSEIHQSDKLKLGIQDFYYTVADKTPDEVTKSRNDNISPINIKSKIHLNHITNQSMPEGKVLKFANTTALVDSGNLFADVITEGLCQQLGIEYESKSKPSLHSANGQPIDVIGRVKDNIFFKFNGLGTFYNIRPFVVKELFCGVMLSVFFTKKYQTSLEAKDDTLRIQTKRGIPRSLVKLHLNTIRIAIEMLDKKDRERLMHDTKKLLPTTEDNKPRVKSMELKETDFDSIGLETQACHGAMRASQAEKVIAFAKHNTPLTRTKINSENAPSALKCDICRKLMVGASKMSCCMNSVCERCGIASLVETGDCYNKKCKGTNSLILDDKSIRKKIKNYIEKKAEKKGKIEYAATVLVSAHVQSLDTNVREVLVENLEHLNGMNVREGVYRRKMDGSIDIWISPSDPDNITHITANQPIAKITPLVPKHQLTKEFGDNVAETFSDVSEVISALTDEWTKTKDRIGKVRDEIEDLTESLKNEAITPQDTVFKINKLTRELKELLDIKTRLEVSNIRKQIPETTCICKNEHIKTRRDIPHDEKKNPNGFTTETKLSYNICTIDWNDEEKTRWLRQQFKLDENEILQEDGKLEEDVIAMLLQNWSCFSVTQSDYGHTDVAQFKIKIKEGMEPFRGKIRPMNPADEVALTEQLTKWLDHGVIERCYSEYASPLFCVTKNGKRRFVIDYRMVNKYIQRDAFPLPNIEENLQKLSGSKVYSTIDATSAFHSVEITPESREYTGFICSQGHFQYVRVPFGLSNGPAMYSRILQRLLLHINSPDLLGYLDDLIVHCKSNRDMLLTLGATFTAHRQFGLKINPAKSEIFQTKVIYLGHLCTEKGIEMVPRYKALLENWEIPKNQKELKTYLGKITYYKRFFSKDFARIKAPLDALRAKDKEFVMGEKELDAFFKLRKLVSSSGENGPLAFPDFSADAGDFITDSDFSIDGLGWSLSQVQGNTERLIGCGGRKTSKSEANYPSAKGEILSMVSCFQDFERILTFKHFFARVDAQALLTLKSTYNIKSHLVSRWAEYISSFNFTPIHRPGELHGNVDHISRYNGLRPPTEDETKAADDAEMPTINSDLIRNQEEIKEVVAGMEDSPIAGRVKKGRERTAVVKFDNSERRIKKKKTVNFERGNEGKEQTCDITENEQPEKEFKDMVTGEDVMVDAENEEIVLSDKIIMGENRERIALTELGPVEAPGVNWSANNLEDAFPIKVEEQLTAKEMLEAQKRDKVLSEIYYWVKSGKKPEKKTIKFRLKDVHWYLALFDYLSIDERGILIYRDNHQNRDLICLPDSLIDRVFTLCHTHPLSGHFALASTLKRIRYRFMFPHMTGLIATKLIGCQGCVQKLAKDPYKHSVFCSREVPGINEKINWDIVGPLPTSPNNNTYILSIIDYFSRWAELIPIPDKSAPTIANAIYTQWICRYGTFAQLHADNSKEFHSNLVEEVAKALQIYQTFTPKYRPGGARVERTHNTIFQAIRALRQSESKRQDEWEDLLQPTLFAYRSSVCRATGFTPALLWLGRELRAPVDIVFPLKEEKYSSTSEFAQNTCKLLKEAFREVNARFENTALVQDSLYSSRPQQRKFEPGQLVLYFSPYRRIGEFRKLHLHWTGPFRISTKISDILYEIVAISDRKGQTPLLATNDRLKIYKEEKRGEKQDEVSVKFPYFVTDIVIQDGKLDEELTREVSILEFPDLGNDGSTELSGSDEEGDASEPETEGVAAPRGAQSSTPKDAKSTGVIGPSSDMPLAIDADTETDVVMESDTEVDRTERTEEEPPRPVKRQREETPTKNQVQVEKVSRRYSPEVVRKLYEETTNAEEEELALARNVADKFIHLK